MPTIAKDMARGCGRDMIVRIVAALIVLPLGCVCVFAPLFLVDTLDLPMWVLIVSLALYMLILFGGGAAAIGVVIYRRKANLDAAFTPFGLAGSAYSTFFRQYHGAMQGRQADVWLYRGPVLEIEISTPLQTRLGVTGAHGDTRFFAGLLNKPPLTLADPALGDLSVFPLDEDWARALLADPHAADLLRRLTATTGQFTRQQVILRPGAFKLMLSGSRHLFKFQVTPEEARQWLDDLLALAGLAERLPAPQVTDVESSAEQLAKRLRQRNPYLALWVGLGTLAGILLCSGVIIALVLLLDRMAQ